MLNVWAARGCMQHDTCLSPALLYTGGKGRVPAGMVVELSAKIGYFEIAGWRQSKYNVISDHCYFLETSLCLNALAKHPIHREIGGSGRASTGQAWRHPLRGSWDASFVKHIHRESLLCSPHFLGTTDLLPIQWTLFSFRKQNSSQSLCWSLLALHHNWSHNPNCSALDFNHILLKQGESSIHKSSCTYFCMPNYL